MLPYTRMSLKRKNCRGFSFFLHIYLSIPSPTNTRSEMASGWKIYTNIEALSGRIERTEKSYISQNLRTECVCSSQETCPLPSFGSIHYPFLASKSNLPTHKPDLFNVRLCVSHVYLFCLMIIIFWSHLFSKQAHKVHIHTSNTHDCSLWGFFPVQSVNASLSDVYAVQRMKDAVFLYLTHITMTHFSETFLFFQSENDVRLLLSMY